MSKIQISPWVSQRTYYLRENFSVSLIHDSKHGLYYLLKGVCSSLWNLIIQNQEIDKVYHFADKNSLNSQLTALLSELKEKRIINPDKTFEKSNYNYLSYAISEESPNFKYFYKKWVTFTSCIGYINSLNLELNYKCNLNCKHCYNHKNMDEYFISFEQAKKSVDEAYNLGIIRVVLTGGECMLNKDFIKIAGYIRSKYLNLYVSTNGQILHDNKKIFNELLSLYPSKIKISLYSMEQKIHDYITGVDGSWQKTVNVIKKLKNSGVKVSISTPVLSCNKDSYKKVIEFGKSIGVKVAEYPSFINNPENNNLSLKLDYKTLEQYYTDKLKEHEFLRSGKFEKTYIAICEAGCEKLCITPKLDVTPCIAFDYILGNLNSATLKEIKETSLKDFRKNFIRKNLTECFNEKYCKYCIYCPDASCFNNTFMKKQPILCEEAKAYYNAVLYHEKKGNNSENSCKIQ